MSDYRILVTGSRDYTAERYVQLILQPLIELALGRQQRPIVIQGGCPLGGADLLAERAADRYGAGVETFYADWEKYGKAAGPIRNQEMVDAGADICVAFPLSSSRGTYDCIARAREAGIPVWEVPPYE